MAPVLKFQTLTNVIISDEERISGTLSPENAALAIHAIHTDGLVCIENAVNLEHIEILNKNLTAEVEALSKQRNTNFVNVR
jgi:hypothetical protein